MRIPSCHSTTQFTSISSLSSVSRSELQEAFFITDTCPSVALTWKNEGKEKKIYSFPYTFVQPRFLLAEVFSNTFSVSWCPKFGDVSSLVSVRWPVRSVVQPGLASLTG